MKCLIVGGTSLLGKYLFYTKPDEVELYQTWYTNPSLQGLQLDVCNKSQVAYVFERVNPDVVIHCSAIGSVDYTEQHTVETRMVNVHGMENVLKAAKSHRALFVYISSNAVFAGDNPPYLEDSDRIPVNWYGLIKREAENLIFEYSNWLIVRPFMLYGWPYPGSRKNWATTILTKLQLKEEIKLVNDVWWMPTYVSDIAQAIWTLIELSNPDQMYNVAADDRMTLYDFGLKIAKVWNLDSKLVQPISSDELKGITKRPIDTTYDLSKIKNLDLILSPVEEGLTEMRDWPKRRHPIQ